jgi:hypothetical protein
MTYRELLIEAGLSGHWLESPPETTVIVAEKAIELIDAMRTENDLLSNTILLLSAEVDALGGSE